jgi:hypothetical protein
MQVIQEGVSHQKNFVKKLQEEIFSAVDDPLAVDLKEGFIFPHPEVFTPGENDAGNLHEIILSAAIISFRVTDLLEVGGVIKIRAVGRIMAFEALVFANPEKGFTQLRMAVPGAVAGFTLDIGEVGCRVFSRLTITGSVATEAARVGRFILPNQGLVSPGMGRFQPALMLRLMARKTDPFTDEGSGRGSRYLHAGDAGAFRRVGLE